MEQQTPVVVQDEMSWVVRVPRDNGKVQEYRCATEQQAKQLALVLKPPAK